MISSHYRAPVNFSEEVMENAAKELNKILNPIRQAQIQLQINDVEANTLDEERMNKFLLTLADDLNTSNAISVIHETVKEINLSLRSKDYTKMSLATKTVLEMLNVLGTRVNNVVLDDEAKDLFRKWEEARKNKDFQTADVYRNLLIEKGLL
jgi:cysteinyl-tRNA synthetase